MLIENLVCPSCWKIICALCISLHTPVLLFAFHSLLKSTECQGEHNCWGHLVYLMPLGLILNIWWIFSLLCSLHEIYCLFIIKKYNIYLKEHEYLIGTCFDIMSSSSGPSKWDFIYYVLLCWRVYRWNEFKCGTHTIKKHISLADRVHYRYV